MSAGADQPATLAARVPRVPLIRIIVALLFVAVPVAALQLAGQTLALGWPVFAPIVILVTFASYHAYVRLIEKRRPVAELARRGAVAQAGIGFLVGAALFGATMLVLWSIGVARIGPGTGWGALVPAFAAALAAAASEEVLLRGVVFRIVSERLGDRAALAISAALFGALHAANPGATLISSVAIALEAGVLLAAAFMVTRQLWLPIGMHAAWNFTEGGVFGASVSGHEVQGLLSSRFEGHDLLTGGSFGPEASIVAVFICLAASAALLGLARVVARSRSATAGPG